MRTRSPSSTSNARPGTRDIRGRNCVTDHLVPRKSSGVPRLAVPAETTWFARPAHTSSHPFGMAIRECDDQSGCHRACLREQKVSTERLNHRFPKGAHGSLASDRWSTSVPNAPWRVDYKARVGLGVSWLVASTRMCVAPIRRRVPLTAWRASSGRLQSRLKCPR